MTTALALGTIFVVAAIYWNEARKEVIYLCNNFNKGVPQSSVIRQLETINLSRFQVEKKATGIEITLYSRLNFAYYKCIIKINASGKVEQAQVD